MWLKFCDQNFVIKTLWPTFCDQYFLTNMLWPNLVPKMLWPKCCEQNVVTKILWPKCCDLNFVTKTLWLKCCDSQLPDNIFQPFKEQKWYPSQGPSQGQRFAILRCFCPPAYFLWHIFPYRNFPINSFSLPWHIFFAGLQEKLQSGWLQVRVEYWAVEIRLNKC